MKKQASEHRNRLAKIAWEVRREARKLGPFVVPKQFREAMEKQGYKYRKTQ